MPPCQVQQLDTGKQSIVLFGIQTISEKFIASIKFVGLPPGSASSSFQRMGRAASVVLTDYDASWASNAGTAGDIKETLDQSKLTRAAVLVARSALEASSKGSSEHLNTTGAERAVSDALRCVGTKGLDCPLSTALLGESAAVLSSYIGVLYSITAGMRSASRGHVSTLDT